MIDVAPGPSLAGLEGRNHRVAGPLEVFRGVAARRTVTTSDVTAAQAETQMNPQCAEFQALLTTKRPWRNRLKLVQMLA